MLYNFLTMGTRYRYKHSYKTAVPGIGTIIKATQKTTGLHAIEKDFYSLFKDVNYLGIQARIAGIRLTGFTVAADLIKLKKHHAIVEQKYQTHFSTGKNSIAYAGHAAYVKFTFQFFEGSLNNKRKIIAIAHKTFKGVPSSNVMAAEMDNRLILYLEAAIKNNEYFLGDTSSAHYHLTKYGDFLTGTFINGNAHVQVSFKKLKSQFNKEKEMKDFFKEL